MDAFVTGRNPETVCAPGSGVICAQARGRGGCVIAFDDPENGDVVSPLGGVITHVGRTGVVSIRSESGTEVSVGIGVRRHGRIAEQEGCHLYVREGDTVRVGQRLMHAELGRIRRLGGATECVMTLDGAGGVWHPAAENDGMTVRAGVTPVLRVERGGAGELPKKT